jgi:hypothetical protein
MAQETAQHEIAEVGGVLVGPYRRPRNLGNNQAGSIHDDATAQGLGFRGGTIAGSIHMEQFPPLLLRAFGERWFETGSLSCYFRYATTDNEPVRCHVRLPSPGDDAQVDVWMEHENGALVLEGTAAIGAPAEPSFLRQRLAEPPSRGDVRILAHLQPGQEMPATSTRLDVEQRARRRAVMTEPLAWYSGPSPWGGPIADPGAIVGLMRPVERGVDIRRNRAVGLFGAIEVRHLSGPVFLDRAYEVSGRILAVGETPKSEYFWYESTLREPAGKDVASMIMMLRFMKGSSPLWSDA